MKKTTDRLGALFPSRAPGAAPTVETSLASNLQLAFAGVAAAVGLIIFYGNVASVLVPYSQEVPGRPDRFTYPLGLDQRWTMFCDPTRMTGWMVAPIRKEDGTLVDVITGKRSGLAEKPELPSELYGNWRWRSFVTLTLWRANGTRYIGDYANYLCRTWNGAHRDGERAKDLEVVFMRQMLGHDDGAPGPVERVNLWKGSCPAGS